jgi:hypothetical protein
MKMASLRLEIGEDEKGHTCECCGHPSSTGHGFVYRDDTAFAVYYAGWCEAHRDRGVTLAIAIGEWDEGSTVDQRTCFGIEAYEGQDEILFSVIDPELSPWPDTKLLGRMMRRDEALVNALLSDALAVAEEIVRGHPAIRRFLNASE